MALIDLTKRKLNEDFKLSMSDTVNFSWTFKCGELADTGYTLKLCKDGELIYDWSSYIISDTDANVIKFFKEADLTLEKGVYDYTWENVNKDIPSVNFYLEGKMIITK